MLLRFRVSNFRSINGTEELSMVATKLKHDNKTVDLVQTSEKIGADLIPSVVIYGPNGAGKSNLLNALSFLRDAVLFSNQKDSPVFSMRSLVGFRLIDDEETRHSTFELVIEIDGVRHDYIIELDRERIYEESLYHYPHGVKSIVFKRLFEKEIVFGRMAIGRGVRSISSLVGDSVLFVSVAKELKFAPAIALSDAIESMGYFDAEGLPISHFGDFFSDFPMDPRQKSFLANIGTGVQDYRIREYSIPPEILSLSEKMNSVIREFGGAMNALDVRPPQLGHSMELEHKTSTGKKVYFPVAWESAGTIRLLALMKFIFDTLNDGTVLLVDEIDISLHTGVVDAILSLFALRETNPKGAQLIVTTHDTNLLNSQYLRRDQIWFAEKDESGASHFTPLSDFSVRKDAPIEAGYLQGRFGAIPFSGSPEKLLQS